jgi:hypothetical protein
MALQEYQSVAKREFECHQTGRVVGEQQGPCCNRLIHKVEGGEIEEDS